MTLSLVIITDNIIQECFAHAYMTEREEIMGVLLGEMIPCLDGGKNTKTARIWASKVIQRKDKRPDRVEIAPEHLCVATEYAETITAQCQRHTRVLGWYHSHPHITPYPSAVDLNCQDGFQYMESGWVGLIFSVFHADSFHGNSATVHAFQTGVTGTHEKIPIQVVPSITIFPSGFGTCRETSTLMDTFRKETQEFQAEYRALCQNDAHAQTLIDHVAECQTYSVERLLGDNTRHYLLEVHLPELRRKVAELRAEVAARNAAAAQSCP